MIQMEYCLLMNRLVLSMKSIKKLETRRNVKWSLSMMERQHYMELTFKLTKIHPKNDLAVKFNRLGYESSIQRIFASINLFNSGLEVVYSTEGIIDTGAAISIFPGEIFKELQVKKYETHTMWGIINKKECHIVVDIAELFIQLIDINELESQKIKVLAGFTRQTKVPILIGMKSILEKYSYSYTKELSKFKIKFPE